MDQLDLARVFTVSDDILFYKMPKQLFNKRSKYFKLSTDAKVLYTIMLDRYSLSMVNGWVDDHGAYYCYFSYEAVMELLSIKKEKTSKLFKELKEANLLYSYRQGLGKPNRQYVYKLETEMYTLEELAERRRIREDQEKNTGLSGFDMNGHLVEQL